MPGTEKSPPTRGDPYQITLQGRLDGTWAEWFGGMRISLAEDAQGEPITILRGSFPDQAVLRGALVKLWDLNAIVIEVRRLPPQAGLATKHNGGYQNESNISAQTKG